MKIFTLISFLATVFFIWIYKDSAFPNKKLEKVAIKPCYVCDLTSHQDIFLHTPEQYLESLREIFEKNKRLQMWGTCELARSKNINKHANKRIDDLLEMGWKENEISVNIYKKSEINAPELISFDTIQTHKKLCEKFGKDIEETAVQSGLSVANDCRKDPNGVLVQIRCATPEKLKQLGNVVVKNGIEFDLSWKNDEQKLKFQTLLSNLENTEIL